MDEGLMLHLDLAFAFIIKKKKKLNFLNQNELCRNQMEEIINIMNSDDKKMDQFIFNSLFHCKFPQQRFVKSHIPKAKMTV
jgi:hypothetical protein